MSTTPEIQQNLTADGKLFPDGFDDASGRRWVVKKIVAHHANAADVETASRQALLKAKALFDTYQNPPDKRPYLRTDSANVTYHLARVMYGALGVYPEIFLDQDNTALLHFVVERRLRTILQMRDYVNASFGSNPDNQLRYFSFPSIDVWHSSLRPMARQYWKPNQGVHTDIWPFVLSPAGIADPVAAVNSLFHFQVPVDDDDTHEVECQTAATMVALDSLLASANAASVLASLVEIDPNYVTVDYPDGALRQAARGVAVGGLFVVSERAEENSSSIKLVPPFSEFANRPPTGDLMTMEGAVENVTIPTLTAPSVVNVPVRTSSGALAPTTLNLSEPLLSPFDRGTRFIPEEYPFVHFLSDTAKEFALFEQGFVQLDDLQPGDIVHVLGHPLVRSKIPASPYGGERCVVVNPWAHRDLIPVTGHGIGETTILKLMFYMVEVANRLLTVSRLVLTRCLTMTANPLAAGTVPTPNVNDVDAVALEKRIKEAIAKALNVNDDSWTAADFFIGTWRVFDLPMIPAEELPWWEQLSDEPYPRHWALAAEGTVRIRGVDHPLGHDQFFAFAYSPDEFDKNDPDVLAWPREIPKNFVGLLWRNNYNAGASDQRRQFCIEYVDDQAGTSVRMPLYEKGAANAAAESILLQYDDLSPQLFSLVKDDTEAWVIRPRVSAEAAYLNRLRTIGALPNAP